METNINTPRQEMRKIRKSIRAGWKETKKAFRRNKNVRRKNREIRRYGKVLTPQERHFKRKIRRKRMRIFNTGKWKQKARTHRAIAPMRLAFKAQVAQNRYGLATRLKAIKDNPNKANLWNRICKAFEGFGADCNEYIEVIEKGHNDIHQASDFAGWQGWSAGARPAPAPMYSEIGGAYGLQAGSIFNYGTSNVANPFQMESGAIEGDDKETRMYNWGVYSNASGSQESATMMAVIIPLAEESESLNITDAEREQISSSAQKEIRDSVNLNDDEKDTLIAAIEDAEDSDTDDVDNTGDMDVAEKKFLGLSKNQWMLAGGALGILLIGSYLLKNKKK